MNRFSLCVLLISVLVGACSAGTETPAASSIESGSNIPEAGAGSLQPANAIVPTQESTTSITDAVDYIAVIEAHSELNSPTPPAQSGHFVQRFDARFYRLAKPESAENLIARTGIENRGCTKEAAGEGYDWRLIDEAAFADFELVSAGEVLPITSLNGSYVELSLTDESLEEGLTERYRYSAETTTGWSTRPEAMTLFVPGEVFPAIGQLDLPVRHYLRATILQEYEGGGSFCFSCLPNPPFDIRPDYTVTTTEVGPGGPGSELLMTRYIDKLVFEDGSRVATSTTGEAAHCVLDWEAKSLLDEDETSPIYGYYDSFGAGRAGVVAERVGDVLVLMTYLESRNHTLDPRID